MPFTHLHDPSSQSNLRFFTIESLELKLTADFESQKLIGSAALAVRISGHTSRLILDTRDLAILSVSLDSTPCNFNFHAAHPAFGSALEISIPVSPADRSASLVIEYSTSPSASAIQWLPPSQTSGKVHPYLFTQCQAIHARSLFPCQDSPAIKFPYKAELRVPKPLVALMSAISTGERADQDGKHTIYSFEQKVPIPSYLLAIAIGALESRQIGPRSRVWSEKEIVDKAAFEFAETEKFLQTAESIVGPYQWGEYNVLVLPGSFPYGGMENPTLTFATPTLLAGDRSLADVIIHEASHSWFGNQITAGTWESFFLNEGMTVFLERKIIGAMHGKARQHLSAHIGWNSLCHSCQLFGMNHEFTKLMPNLHDVDPDDAFSSVPYEKGFSFMVYLEEQVGGDQLMNPFLRAYCDHFAHQSVTAHDFKDFFLEYFRSRHPELKEKLADIDWPIWFTQPGLPIQPKLDLSLVSQAENLASQLASGAKQAAVDDLKGYSSQQTVVLLERLQDVQKSADKGQFAAMLLDITKTYGFAQSQNSEIISRWLHLVIRAGFAGELANYRAKLVEFLGSQGRMKFIRPLYRDWFSVEPERARDAFKSMREIYHSIASKMVGRYLGIDSA